MVVAGRTYRYGIPDAAVHGSFPVAVVHGSFPVDGYRGCSRAKDMVPVRLRVAMAEESTATRAEPPDDEPNTLVNSLVGAVVTIVTAPLLPLAAVAGGGVAGYLQRGDVREGAKAGALSGAIAAVPAFLLVWFVVGFLLLGADPFFAFSALFAIALFVVVVGYLVGAGALGGALGAHLRGEL